MKRLHEETTSSPFKEKNGKVRKSNYQIILTLDETIGSNLLYHKFKYQTLELQLFLQHVPILYWYPLQLIGTANFKYNIDSCVFSAVVRNPLHQYSTGHLITSLSDRNGEYHYDSEYGSDDYNRESDDDDDIGELYDHYLNITLEDIINFIKNESSNKLRKLHSLLTSLVNDKLFIEQVTRKTLSVEKSITEKTKRNKYLEIYKSWTEGITLADSEQMKDNEEIVLEVIKLNSKALQYASDRLRDDVVFMLKVIEQTNFSVLSHASDRLIDNEAFLLEVVKREDHALKYASNRLKDDYQFILKAVKENGYALLYASKRLKDNEEIVLEAIQQDGEVLDASERFRDNEKFVKLAVKQNGNALYFASGIFQDNEQIVLEAVKQNGCSFKYASKRLQDNEEIVREAIKQDGRALKYASKRLRNDFNFANEIFKCCNSLDVFQYFGKELLSFEFIYYFIENYQSRFHELVRREY